MNNPKVQIRNNLNSKHVGCEKEPEWMEFLNIYSGGRELRVDYPAMVSVASADYGST